MASHPLSNTSSTSSASSIIPPPVVLPSTSAASSAMPDSTSPVLPALGGGSAASSALSLLPPPAPLQGRLSRCNICFEDDILESTGYGCASPGHASCLPCAVKYILPRLSVGLVELPCPFCPAPLCGAALHAIALWSRSLLAKRQHHCGLLSDRLLSFYHARGRAFQDDESREVPRGAELTAIVAAMNDAAPQPPRPQPFEALPSDFQALAEPPPTHPLASLPQPQRQALVQEAHSRFPAALRTANFWLGYKATRTKPCPTCATGVARARGHHCHHISPASNGCSYCRTHFCYSCLGMHPCEQCPTYCSSSCQCLDCEVCAEGRPCDDCDNDGRCRVCQPHRGGVPQELGEEEYDGQYGGGQYGGGYYGGNGEDGAQDQDYHQYVAGGAQAVEAVLASLEEEGTSPRAVAAALNNTTLLQHFLPHEQAQHYPALWDGALAQLLSVADDGRGDLGRPEAGVVPELAAFLTRMLPPAPPQAQGQTAAAAAAAAAAQPPPPPLPPLTLELLARACTVLAYLSRGSATGVAGVSAAAGGLLVQALLAGLRAGSVSGARLCYSAAWALWNCALERGVSAACSSAGLPEALSGGRWVEDGATEEGVVEQVDAAAAAAGSPELQQPLHSMGQRLLARLVAGAQQPGQGDTVLSCVRLMYPGGVLDHRVTEAGCCCLARLLPGTGGGAAAAARIGGGGSASSTSSAAATPEGSEDASCGLQLSLDYVCTVLVKVLASPASSPLACHHALACLTACLPQLQPAQPPDLLPTLLALLRRFPLEALDGQVVGGVPLAICGPAAALLAPCLPVQELHSMRSSGRFLSKFSAHYSAVLGSVFAAVVRPLYHHAQLLASEGIAPASSTSPSSSSSSSSSSSPEAEEPADSLPVAACRSAMLTMRTVLECSHDFAVHRATLPALLLLLTPAMARQRASVAWPAARLLSSCVAGSTSAEECRRLCPGLVPGLAGFLASIPAAAQASSDIYVALWDNLGFLLHLPPGTPREQAAALGGEYAAILRSAALSGAGGCGLTLPQLCEALCQQEDTTLGMLAAATRVCAGVLALPSSPALELAHQQLAEAQGDAATATAAAAAAATAAQCNVSLFMGFALRAAASNGHAAMCEWAASALRCLTLQCDYDYGSHSVAALCLPPGGVAEAMLMLLWGSTFALAALPSEGAARPAPAGLTEHQLTDFPLTSATSAASALVQTLEEVLDCAPFGAPPECQERQMLAQAVGDAAGTTTSSPSSFSHSGGGGSPAEASSSGSAAPAAAAAAAATTVPEALTHAILSHLPCLELLYSACRALRHYARLQLGPLDHGCLFTALLQAFVLHSASGARQPQQLLVCTELALTLAEVLRAAGGQLAPSLPHCRLLPATLALLQQHTSSQGAEEAARTVYGSHSLLTTLQALSALLQALAAHHPKGPGSGWDSAQALRALQGLLACLLALPAMSRARGLGLTLDGRVLLEAAFHSACSAVVQCLDSEGAVGVCYAWDRGEGCLARSLLRAPYPVFDAAALPVEMEVDPEAPVSAETAAQRGRLLLQVSEARAGAEGSTGPMDALCALLKGGSSAGGSAAHYAHLAVAYGAMPLLLRVLKEHGEDSLSGHPRGASVTPACTAIAALVTAFPHYGPVLLQEGCDTPLRALANMSMFKGCKRAAVECLRALGLDKDGQLLHVPVAVVRAVGGGAASPAPALTVKAPPVAAEAATNTSPLPTPSPAAATTTTPTPPYTAATVEEVVALLASATSPLLARAAHLLSAMPSSEDGSPAAQLLAPSVLRYHMSNMAEAEGGSSSSSSSSSAVQCSSALHSVRELSAALPATFQAQCPRALSEEAQLVLGRFSREEACSGAEELAAGAGGGGGGSRVPPSLSACQHAAALLCSLTKSHRGWFTEGGTGALDAVLKALGGARVFWAGQSGRFSGEAIGELRASCEAAIRNLGFGEKMPALGSDGKLVIKGKK